MKKAAIVCLASVAGTVSALSVHAKCKSKAWDYNWDFRQPSSLVKPNSPDEDLEKRKSATRRTLYLIRHGQYELDKQHDKEKILTDLGRQQAECTGKHLAKLGVKYSDLVISTMTRANETGEIILKQLNETGMEVLNENFEIEKTDLLREGHPIDSVPSSSRFKPDSWEFTDGARIEAAFRKYFHRAHYSQKEDSYEIVVCHANVIRYLVCRASQNPPEGWLRMSLANGSITEVVLEPNGKVSISGIGDKGHMPINKITFT
ncbi:serine/threonine-protein phosphatase PGAM5, mitochondrial-like [Bolinopsis microptera]|uniref:serine/threonine-protein phosphatase PGAM5, mitochondrial-like n=1 Tax=Bolinopsis microptera TaxID=2820187 RepID=UPI00307AE613